MQRILIPAIAAGIAAGCATDSADEAAEAVVEAVADTVVLETTLGRVVIALENERAPISVENFLLHVRSGFYDGLVFHRIEDGFLIQAGEVDTLFRKRTSPVFPIENEADNGLSNARGAVGMARTGDPHSATSQFYINLVDNASKLDFREATTAGWGYAVFGAVVEGMSAVDSMARLSTEARSRLYGHFPVDPPAITRAYIATAR